MPGIWVLFYDFLYHHSQPIKTTTHVGRSTSNPNLCPHRHRDHDPYASSASANGATRVGAVPSQSRTIRPLRNFDDAITLMIASRQRPGAAPARNRNQRKARLTFRRPRQSASFCLMSPAVYEIRIETMPARDLSHARVGRQALANNLELVCRCPSTPF